MTDGRVRIAGSAPTGTWQRSSSVFFSVLQSNLPEGRLVLVRSLINSIDELRQILDDVRKQDSESKSLFLNMNSLKGKWKIAG